MTTDSAYGKLFEHAVTIHASPEVVWKAIASGEELRRWFPIDARVREPGADGRGGTVFLSWGPACEGEAPITLWEPGRAIGWCEKHDGGAVEIAAHFEISRSPDQRGTVLKVVQSGFGRGAKWDDMYDSISNGWKFELASLRHYLSHHLGKDRRCEWAPVPSAKSVQATWSSLTQPGALVSGGSIRGHAEGAAYAFTGPDGSTYSGTVIRNIENKTFSGTVRELDDALLRIEIERFGATPDGAGCTPCLWLSVWGPQGDKVPAIAAAWRDAIARLLAE